MQQHEAAKAPRSTARTSPPKQTVTADVPAPKRLPALPQEQITTKLPSPVRVQPQPTATRGKKRMSPEIQIASDKENGNDVADTLPVAKNIKRGKATAPMRVNSRSAVNKQASVLSPRSHNSRTLPRSPIKGEPHQPYLPSSPAKSLIARPTTAMSPIRPTSPLKSAATAASSAISASMHGMMEHAKRGGNATAAKFTRTASKEKKEVGPRGQMLPPPKPHINTSAPPSPQRAFSQTSMHSNSTDVSTASSGTTVVKAKRGGRTAAPSNATKKSPAGVEKKKGGLARAASAAKTALKRNANAAGTAAGTASKKVVVAEPAAGRRVLRKRA